MRALNFVVVIITGALLIYGAQAMPKWADPHSPPAMHVSPRYIKKTVEETATPNMVTSVLADYRGYDTLGETSVIFTAGIACILLLRKKKEKTPGE